MHNAAFAHLGLDYVYVPLHVEPAQLKAAVAGIRAFNLVGVNVTVPHKERILPLLDVVSDSARMAGAVNTIVHRSGRLEGENTDSKGFLRALQDVQVRPRGRRFLLIGAGGAARGVAAALVHAGARSIVIANRTLSRAQRLTRLLAGNGSAVRAADLGVLTRKETVTSVDVIVNATVAGLHDEPFPALAYGASHPRCLFYDLLYGRTTDFLRRARAAGRPTLDGTSMLLYQGAAAFSLWTRRPAPLAVMADALGLNWPLKKQIDNRTGRR